MGILSF